VIGTLAVDGWAWNIWYSEYIFFLQAPSVAAGRDFDSSVFLLVTDCFVAIWSLKLCVEISFDSVR